MGDLVEQTPKCSKVDASQHPEVQRMKVRGFRARAGRAVHRHDAPAWSGIDGVVDKGEAAVTMEPIVQCDDRGNLVRRSNTSLLYPGRN